MIDTDINLDGALVIHTGVDSVSIKDILSATRYWFTHPAFDPRRPVIWDVGSALLDLSLEELSEAYALIRSAVSSKRQGGRTAWVHPSGVVRAMIDVIADEFDWGSEWQTFPALEDALDWCLERD